MLNCKVIVSLLHNVCSQAGLPTGLDLPPPVGVGLLGWDLPSTIHQCGYFTGSSFPLPDPVWDQKWDQPWDGTAGTLGQAPPVRA